MRHLYRRSNPYRVNSPEVRRYLCCIAAIAYQKPCATELNFCTTHIEMKTPLRIAILECDTPPPEVVALYGAYDRIFTTLLEKAAEGVGLDPRKDLQLSAFEVVTKQEYPSLEDVDAVLISGSSECHLQSSFVSFVQARAK